MEDEIKVYLDRLRSTLRSLTSHEREQILSEIESHFTEGLEDERLGATRKARRAVLMREMGNPHTLGHELQQLRRRQRWGDYLLAVIPALFVAELLEVVVRLISYPSTTPLFNEVALTTLPLLLLMLLIAHHRASRTLLIFWLLVTLDKALIALQWSALGNPQLHFAAFWGAVCLAVFGWYLLVLWRVRHFPLLLTFGCLPLFVKVLENVSVLNGIITVIPFTVGSGSSVVTSFYLWPVVVASTLALTLISLALFFLARNHSLRWLGLCLYVSAPPLASASFFGLNGAGSHLLLVLPIALITVGAGILLELRQTRISVAHSK